MHHVSGIRVAHVRSPDRGVRVNRPEPVNGPIAWERMQRVAGLKLRQGRGSSGLEYIVRQGRGEWRVTVRGTRSEMQIGAARLKDHARSLAEMWESAVLSGRIDMAA